MVKLAKLKTWDEFMEDECPEIKKEENEFNNNYDDNLGDYNLYLYNEDYIDEQEE